MRLAGECFLVILSGLLIPAGCFALFKLARLVEDCRAERAKLDNRRGK